MAGFDTQLPFPFVLVPYEGLQQLLKVDNDGDAQPTDAKSAAAESCFTAGGVHCHVVDAAVKVVIPATPKEAPNAKRNRDNADVLTQAKYRVHDELVLPNYYSAVVDLQDWRTRMDDADPTVHVCCLGVYTCCLMHACVSPHRHSRTLPCTLLFLPLSLMLHLTTRSLSELGSTHAGSAA